MELRFTSAICAATLATFSVVPDRATADETGRYVAFPAGQYGMAGLWIMDTQTGEAKLCFRTKGLEGMVVECTPPAFTRSGQDKPRRYGRENLADPLHTDEGTAGLFDDLVPPEAGAAPPPASEANDPWAEFRLVPRVE